MKILIENMGKIQDKFLSTFTKENQFWSGEKNIGCMLQQLFPISTISYNKSIKLNGRLFRPDYQISKPKIIVEFQGDYHYCKSKVVYTDKIRKEIFENNGWVFIEIPYFIQLSKDVTEYLFKDYVSYNLIKDFSSGYPHGFIQPTSGSFGDFCLEGLNKAKIIIESFPPMVKEQCFQSLKKRSNLDNIPLKYYNPYA